MLYSCTHMATVGVKGLKQFTLLCGLTDVLTEPDLSQRHSLFHVRCLIMAYMLRGILITDGLVTYERLISSSRE